MPQIKKNARCEDRIMKEAIVDARPEEQAMGWYYYLQDKITFPFSARCSRERPISPLRKGQTVEVTGMAPEEECGYEMFVEIPWDDRELAIPLAQVKPSRSADAETKEAVGDWHYWVDRGYEL